MKLKLMFVSLKNIIQTLQSNNPEFRLTMQREIIISSMLSMSGHFSAEDVTKDINQKFPDLKGISNGTIY